ncbi:hypothetical protein A4A49_24833 [Nicotiana attenuata]|uniref:Uncharacterized protein n=1 Tax=Nicotiana attenuata TaxID=49451 RepID=A0A1J6IDL4_NICAT|nr:hypothetical protein A4A49_24833 [Nicotiana attenuata]
MYMEYSRVKQRQRQNQVAAQIAFTQPINQNVCRDPKATDSTKVLEFPTEIIFQQQLVHVHDQPAVVDAELFEKPAGYKTITLNRVQVCDGEKQVSKDPTVDRVSQQGCTQVCRGNKAVQQLNNGQGQINIVLDVTVVRAELVEKPAGFKPIVVHDERQELECVDNVLKNENCQASENDAAESTGYEGDFEHVPLCNTFTNIFFSHILRTVATTSDKAMLEQANNCPNSPSDQSNAGINLGCDLASEVQNKLPEGPVHVAGENTLFSNKAGSFLRCGYPLTRLPLILNFVQPHQTNPPQQYFLRKIYYPIEQKELDQVLSHEHTHFCHFRIPENTHRLSQATLRGAEGTHDQQQLVKLQLKETVGGQKIVTVNKDKVLNQFGNVVSVDDASKIDKGPPKPTRDVPASSKTVNKASAGVEHAVTRLLKSTGAGNATADRATFICNSMAKGAGQVGVHNTKPED